jgi:ATP-dependent helicase HrpA
MPANFQSLETQLSQAMEADRHNLRRQLRLIAAAAEGGKPLDERLARWQEQLAKSIDRCESRRKNRPALTFDPDLPVSGKRDEIAQTIQDNQVVIVCGETGSGKSTQLPKICLEMGRGISGLIGHTQPRRIAARSVAARIAEEVGTPLGRDVGYKVRFSEALGPNTYIKLMTDGILLAESQGDPFFDHYDTIILDEAHERSLNIDFLIGYIKRLLPKRPDLRLIITSATIDAGRFAEHFATAAGPAPVIEVSGRTYPVDVLWRPLVPDDNGDVPELYEAVQAAVDEVTRIDRGDVLIFMPTERHIHEMTKTLRGGSLGDASKSATEILPLYARLSIPEQQRVFQPGGKRRIVLATNVAESSITVPRIRFVIDPGTARISRYSPRSKTQRLPIEPVSQASADQRRGRCGRVGPGICVRLFSEADYQSRDRFTMPEIQRTNLASVILQMKTLRLGELEDFPLIDPPKPEAIRDGYRTLEELGAIDEHGDLTEIGKELGRLPVDPRIGRIIVAARDEGCLDEVLIIAAALEAQDPRERPLEKQEAADNCHRQFADSQSDFLGYLKLWDFYHRLKTSTSRNQLQRACRQNFLSYVRIREWLDVHRELLELVDGAEFGAKVGGDSQRSKRAERRHERRSERNNDRGGREQEETHPKYDAIHRAILTGLLSSIAMRTDGHDYNVAGGGKGNLWPGSGIFQGKPKWIVAAEIVETTRRYLRCCGRIDPRWLEPLAGHLMKRTYSELHWNRDMASAVALERVTLFGLVVVAGRQVRYGPIDPDASRQLFIEHGLVQGDMPAKPEPVLRNEALREELDQMQAKLRRNDLVVGDWERSAFYDRVLPPDVFDAVQLKRWLQADPQNPTRLTMTEADLLQEQQAAGAAAFPDHLACGDTNLPLEYRFEPGTPGDGVTLTAPLELLNQLDADRLDWLAPGLVREKVLAMIRSLPKPLRTRFVPAPEVADQVLETLNFGDGNLFRLVANALTRLAGTPVNVDDFQIDRIPPELAMNVRVVDAEGKILGESRDVESLRMQHGAQAVETFTAVDDPRFNRTGIVEWDFDELPEEIEVQRGRVKMKAYPTLIDCGSSVSLQLVDTRRHAEHEMHKGLRRLLLLCKRKDVKSQVDWLPGIDRALADVKPIPNFDLRGQLCELLVDRAWFAEGFSIPRDREAFQRMLQTGGERIGLAVQDLSEVIGPWCHALGEAWRALEAAGAPHLAAQKAVVQKSVQLTWGKLAAPVASPPGKWQYAIDDIRQQLQLLAGPSSLCDTPWPWLRHAPRYFKAITLRLEALATGGMAKDRQRHDEFLPRYTVYRDWLARHGEACWGDAEFVQYRWMLEEYRVSLFAQKLGTSMPVSPKRLEQQWAKVGR